MPDTPAPKKKKKVANKPLLKNARKEKSVGLEANEPTVRKSRRQLAREEGGTAIVMDVVEVKYHALKSTS